MHQRAMTRRFGSVAVHCLQCAGSSSGHLNLGLSGVCDIVEFHQDEQGVPLFGEDGAWMPVPVEYKRGKSKSGECDRLQVCAQAMCLEEMLGCDIASGFLFYKQTQSREPGCFYGGTARLGAKAVGGNA